MSSPFLAADSVLEKDVVFTLLGVEVTATVVATWAMVAVLSALAIYAGRHLQERPSRWQAVAEWGVGGLSGLIDEMTGESGRRYLPLVATMGIFVLIANLMAVLPSVDAPTATISTPAALAVIVFFSVHYFGVRELGLGGYLRTFAEPSVLLLPMNLMAHLTRTFSLAIRLFGNMLSHQIIVAVLLVVLPLVIPAVLEVFGLFIGVLQAYIFTILTVVYIAGAVRAEGEAG
jgi:F-type H+-transporting ATPase subunit a